MDVYNANAIWSKGSTTSFQNSNYTNNRKCLLCLKYVDHTHLIQCVYVYSFISRFTLASLIRYATQFILSTNHTRVLFIFEFSFILYIFLVFDQNANITFHHHHRKIPIVLTCRCTSFITKWKYALIKKRKFDKRVGYSDLVLFFARSKHNDLV